MKKRKVLLVAVGGLALLLLVLPSVASADGGSTTYVVKRGDTLSKIALGFPDLSWREICAANSLPNCNLIFVGQVLTIPSVPGANPGEAEVFNYVPGGPNYTYPEEGAVEQLGDGWTRIRRAANGQYLPWTFHVKMTCDRPVENQLQWDSATKLMIFGEIECNIELRRDLESSQTTSPDPYQVANVKQSPLGLGWFIGGVGTISVNSTETIELKGPGVKQMAFPANWSGTWIIKLQVPSNGLVILNQGERLTNQDNWPLP